MEVSRGLVMDNLISLVDEYYDVAYGRSGEGRAELMGRIRAVVEIGSGTAGLPDEQRELLWSTAVKKSQGDLSWIGEHYHLESQLLKFREAIEVRGRASGASQEQLDELWDTAVTEGRGDPCAIVGRYMLKGQFNVLGWLQD